MSVESERTVTSNLVECSTTIYIELRQNQEEENRHVSLTMWIGVDLHGRVQ